MLKSLRFVFIDNWTEAHTTIAHDEFKYSSLAEMVNKCKSETGGFVFNGIVQIRPSTVALKVNAAHAKLAKAALDEFLPYACQTAHPSSPPTMRLNGLHLAPSLAPIPRNQWSQRLPPRSSKRVHIPSGQPAPHQGRQVSVTEASTTSTLTTMSNALQQLTEQMAKGFASVCTMQDTVASLTDQLQQERQQSAQLRQQVSKLEDDLTQLSTTVKSIQAQTSSSAPNFTASVFQNILETSLGNFADGILNSQSQPSMSQASLSQETVSQASISSKSPKRPISPSSATPRSKRLQRNALELQECNAHIKAISILHDETTPSQLTTAFEYTQASEQSCTDATVTESVQLDDKVSTSTPEDFAVSSEFETMAAKMAEVTKEAEAASSVITINDSTVSAPLTQQSLAQSQELSSAFKGGFTTPTRSLQTPFSPVANNTRRKKSLHQVPQASVAKQNAGGQS
jgi:cell division protein FtsB